MPFKIVIAGAGIGGLTTALFLHHHGHDITIVEASKELNEVGAGIQIPPNATRLLDRIGLLEKLDNVVVKPSHINLRRWANGKIIGKTPLVPEMVDRYDYPYDQRP